MRQARDGILVHLGRAAREAAAGAIEQQHDGEAQAAAPALGFDDELVRRRQVPGAVQHSGAHAGVVALRPAAAQVRTRNSAAICA